MPGKRTTDALFLVQKLQEEHRAEDKRTYMCFVDLGKAFDRAPRRVMEWGMRKKGLPEILVKALMSLHEGAETKVKSWIEAVGRTFCESWCTLRICVVAFVFSNGSR